MTLTAPADRALWSSAVPTLSELHLSDRARRDLGYAAIERILEQSCQSVFGKDALRARPFPASEEGIASRAAEALEGRSLAELQVTPAFSDVVDLRPHLAMIDKEAVLAAGDLMEVGRSLGAIRRVQALIESRADELPRLSGRAAQLGDHSELTRRIGRSFDEESNLTDEASPELFELRERVRHLRVEAQAILEDLIKGFDDRELLRDRNFTIRHGRYVLPVKSEHQSLVDGIVHDASQTGHTVFIEPKQLMHVGNRITIALSAVKQEEQRVLEEMTAEVARLGPSIVADLEQLGELEAAYARGLLTSRIKGRPIDVVRGADPGALVLKEARHAHLTWLRAEAALAGKKADAVIANDVAFGDAHALVITGPNAGGKTVTLKTVGLLAIMARAGLPVPAAEGSTTPLYSAVVAVIGDDQDLKEDLSSFSGHLEALSSALEATREHGARGPVLVIIDEICAGTAPGQGAALAQATLEALVDAGAAVVATTHYERLKTLAIGGSTAARFRNASVALDEQGRPTFKLVLDQVGTSNAFEAAERHGLPGEVIERAKALLDPGGQEVQQLLDRLSEQNAELEAERRKVEEERQKVAEQNAALSSRLDELAQETAKLRREGASAFLGELQQARDKVAKAIEAAQKGADARTLNALSHDLKAEQTRTEKAAAEKPKVVTGAELADVKVGDQVAVTSMPGAVFDVLELAGDEVVVGRGPMRLRKPRSELRKPGGKKAGSTKGGGRSKGKPKERALSEPRTTDNTLDLRGARVAEGLEQLEAFLDRLMHNGRSRAFVLHGHGTGALKQAVRDAARASAYVDSWGPADDDDGGDAFTRITLVDQVSLK